MNRLRFGAALHFIIAIGHVACLFALDEAFEAYGIREIMHQMVSGHVWMLYALTIGLVLVFTVAGLYALSATGDIRRLPLTRTAIITIIVLYSLRALAGIGSEMIREAIRMAESKGMQAVRLDALASNTPAHKIYKCLGFDYRGKQHLYAENTGWTDFYFFEYKYK